MSKRLSPQQWEDASNTISVVENKRSSRRQKVDPFTLMKIVPKTDGQKLMMEAFDDGMNVVAEGSAGTGKSYCATYLALKKLMSKDVERIIIVRSAVNIRSQGFLPGSLEEKEVVYTIPYKNIVDEICQSGTAWESLTKKGHIQFITTTYIRGLTLDNCVVIVDEFQNMDQSECESLLTRLGENSQVIICGDTRQNDLARKRETSCYEWMINLVNLLPQYFKVVRFTSKDIVRSELCKAIIMAIEKL
jgi:phosphate starvation-inducible protein PhoH